MNWKESMRKYVRPNIAEEVDRVVALLEARGLHAAEDVWSAPGISQSVKDALKQGSAAFLDFLML